FGREIRTMRRLGTKLRTHFYRQIAVWLLACCLIIVAAAISPAVVWPAGKGSINANLHANPNASLHGADVFAPIQGGINPAGIIPGTGGIRISGQAIGSSIPNSGLTNTSGSLSVTNQNGVLVHAMNDGLLLSQPRSNVIVKMDSLPQGKSIGGKVKNGVHTSGNEIVMAAGDIFSQAITDLDSSSLTATNGNQQRQRHRQRNGQQWQGPDFNPGGGPNKEGQNGIGEKGWGTGNKGNGVGNTWVGNQGQGQGGGMAGGPEPGQEPNRWRHRWRHRWRRRKGPNPDPDPDPDPDPNPDPDPKLEPVPEPEPAPLAEAVFATVEEEEFDEGGCPALMEWLAGELGIEEDIQVFVGNAFSHSIGIQPCKATARLKNAAKVLTDRDSIRIAALERVINEFVTTPAPLSEEQMALISVALAEHRENETYYTAAGEWITALAEYVSILSTDLGYSLDDSTAVVMEKYGMAITWTGDVTLSEFVQLQLSKPVED
ncbi:MAG: F0F1 ATP synthase subunit delta, partial [Sedimentisphaerales bacterium]|nr:F0F1 ATP synthase subunit delta [Sedimentisphaerales bacterium]